MTLYRDDCDSLPPRLRRCAAPLGMTAGFAPFASFAPSGWRRSRPSGWRRSGRRRSGWRLLGLRRSAVRRSEWSWELGTVRHAGVRADAVAERVIPRIADAPAEVHRRKRE